MDESGRQPAPDVNAPVTGGDTVDAAAFAIAERVVDLPIAEQAEAIARLAPSEAIATRVRSMLGAGERMGEFLEASPVAEALRRPEGLAPGSMIGPWRVEALLGSGSMGDVYRASPAAGGDWRVAVKLMRPGVVPPDLRRRFEFEAATLAKLHHLNIARHIESGIHQGEEGRRPYLVMELVTGTPITAHARERNLDTRATIELFLKACEGVEHAHRSGVIHRDLKPAHLIVEHASGEPKVLDFGVARALDATGTLSSMPGRHLVGTLPYMSPEQAAGDPSRPVDTRADVFAMGAVLYELFAGRPPHDPGEGSMADLLERVMHGVPPRLSTLVSDVARDLDRIVHAAIDPDPSRRYQSVAAMAEDLRRHLRGEPIAIEPPGLWRVLVASARRHRGRFVAAAAVTATIAGLVVFGAVQLVRARAAEERAEQSLREVIDTSRRMLVDANLALYHSRQPLEARRIVLDVTKRQLEAMIERKGDDPAVSATLIQTLTRLASLSGSAGDGSLGLREDAVTLIERAEALSRALVTSHDSANARGVLSVVLEIKSFIVERSLKPGLYSQAVEEAAKATRMAPPDERSAYERKEINLAARLGSTTRDAVLLQRCIDRFRVLVAATPDNADLLDEMGIAEWLLGEVLDDQRLPQARAAFDAARTTLERAIRLGNDHYSNRRLIPTLRLEVLPYRAGGEPTDVLLADCHEALLDSRRAWLESPAGNFARRSHLRAVEIAAEGGLAIAKAAPNVTNVASIVLKQVREELGQLDAHESKANPHVDEPATRAAIAPLLAELEGLAAGTAAASGGVEPAVR